MNARAAGQAVAAAALLAASATAQAEPFDSLHAAAIEERPGAPVPLDGRLRDEAGRQVTLRELAANKPLLVVPVEHACPNLCGYTLEGLAAAIRGQEDVRAGRDFVVVALSIDPRETTADARGSQARLAQAVGAPAGLHALTGQAAEIRAVTNALGYRYGWDPQLRQYAHLAATAALTRRGILTGWIYGVAPEPAELRTAVEQARQDRVGGLGARILLLCYHFAPQTGRYTGAVLTALKWLGAAMVLVLAAVVAVSAARRRQESGR